MATKTSFRMTDKGQATVHTFETPRRNSYSTEIFVRAVVCCLPSAHMGCATVVYGPYDTHTTRESAIAAATTAAFDMLAHHPKVH